MPGRSARMVEFVGAAGNQILLAGKARHPERMDDVETFELKAHIAPDRDVDFVRGLETLSGSEPRYSSPHHHCRPRTLIVRSSLPATLSARVAEQKLATVKALMISTVAATAAITAMVMRRSRRGIEARRHWHGLAAAPKRDDQRDHHQRPDHRADRDDQDDEMLQADRRSAVHVERGLPAAAAGKQQRRRERARQARPIRGSRRRSLVRMNRRGALIEQDRCRCAVFGGPRLFFVVAAGRGGLALNRRRWSAHSRRAARSARSSSCRGTPACRAAGHRGSRRRSRPSRGRNTTSRQGTPGRCRLGRRHGRTCSRTRNRAACPG